MVEVKPDGTQTTIGSGLSRPAGVAVDGSGDVFIADYRQQPRGGGEARRHPDHRRLRAHPPRGVAVDGAGDVFIADSDNTGCWRCRPDGTHDHRRLRVQRPRGVAVDGAGDVFIADTGNSRVRGGDRGPCRVTVSPDPTSVSAHRLGASLDSGQVETFTATVTAPERRDPGRRRRHGQLLRRHHAAGHRDALGQPGDGRRFTTAALALGPHTITAWYSGDSNFAASPPGSQPSSANRSSRPPGSSTPGRGGGRLGRRLHRRLRQSTGWWR